MTKKSHQIQIFILCCRKIYVKGNENTLTIKNLRSLSSELSNLLKFYWCKFLMLNVAFNYPQVNFRFKKAMEQFFKLFQSIIMLFNEALKIFHMDIIRIFFKVVHNFSNPFQPIFLELQTKIIQMANFW
jgi:hypothetical protein